MSRLQSNGNPYEFIAYVSYGDNQPAVRYEISDVSLNVFNYEPIYGAIITHTTEAPVPQGLYLSEIAHGFRWVYPSHGPVVWPCIPVIGVPPEPPVNPTPEPASRWFVILAFLLIGLRLLIRGLRKQSNCGLAGK